MQSFASATVISDFGSNENLLVDLGDSWKI